MTIDLESSLDQLARSVHDDGVAERMTGQVQHMVAQIRRRRAARYTATGLVSMGTVAAVAVAGVQLAGRTATPGPVATQPDTPAGAWPQCGQAAPDVPAVTADTPAGLYVEGSAGPEAVAGDPVSVTLRLVNDGANAVSLDAATPTAFAVVADGLVVATAGWPAETGAIEPGVIQETSGPIDLVACGGDTPLEPGDYQMFAAVTLMLADGPHALAAGPWPFTITEAGPTDATDHAGDERAAIARAEAEARAAEILHRVDALVTEAAARATTFPTCGSIVPSGDDLPLGIDLALGATPFAPGDTVQMDVTVRTTRGRAVIGNAPTAGALIVLTRDGVVVGRGYRAAGDVDMLDLAADQTATVPATGVFSLCTIPQTYAAQDGLPAGMYQAYAVMDVMLQEVTEAGGEAASVTKLVAVRSNPVDITVGVP